MSVTFSISLWRQTGKRSQSADWTWGGRESGGWLSLFSGYGGGGHLINTHTHTLHIIDNGLQQNHATAIIYHWFLQCYRIVAPIHKSKTRIITNKTAVTANTSHSTVCMKKYSAALNGVNGKISVAFVWVITSGHCIQGLSGMCKRAGRGRGGVCVHTWGTMRERQAESGRQRRGWTVQYTPDKGQRDVLFMIQAATEAAGPRLKWARVPVPQSQSCTQPHTRPADTPL